MKTIFALFLAVVFEFSFAQEAVRNKPNFGSMEGYAKAEKEIANRIKQQKEEEDKHCPPPEYRAEIRPYTEFKPGEKQAIKCHRVNDVDRYCIPSESKKDPSRCLTAINKSGCHTKYEKKDLREKLGREISGPYGSSVDLWRILERWEEEAKKVRPEPCLRSSESNAIRH